MPAKFILTVLALGAFGLTKVAFNLAAIRAPALGKVFLADFNAAYSLCVLAVVAYGQAFGAMSNKFVAESVGAGRLDHARRLHTGMLTVLAILAVGALALLLAFAAPVARVLRLGNPAMLVAVAPYVALYAVAFYLKYAYYSFDRIKAYCMAELAACAVFFIALGLATARGIPGLATQAFNLHAGAFCAIALWQLRGCWLWQGAIGALRAEARRLVHFAAHIWVNQMAGFGLWHISILIVSFTGADPAVKAEYSALLHCLTPLNLFPMALSALLLPAFARRYGARSDEAARRLLLGGETAVTLAMVPLCIAGAALAPELVRLAVESDAVAMRAAFVILLASYTIRFHTVPLANYLNATRYVHFMAYIAVAGTAAAAAVWWLAVPMWGAAGAAAGNLALNLATVSLVVRVMHRRAAPGWFRLAPGHWVLGLALAGAAIALGLVPGARAWLGIRAAAALGLSALWWFRHRQGARALASNLQR